MLSSRPPGIFSLILDLIPGLDRGARISKRLQPTASKCIMQASRTRRALRDIPKALSLRVLSTTWGSFQEVFVIMWLSFSCSFPLFFWSSHIPPFCCRVWLLAPWQRRSNIHHQGGWHEYALWDKFLSATCHKLDSYSFLKHDFDKFERNDFCCETLLSDLVAQTQDLCI